MGDTIKLKDDFIFNVCNEIVETYPSFDLNYIANKEDDIYHVYWLLEGKILKTTYDIEEVRENITDGTWIVKEGEPEIVIQKNTNNS